jgi:hypothetical protein
MPTIDSLKEHFGDNKKERSAFVVRAIIKAFPLLFGDKDDMLINVGVVEAQLNEWEEFEMLVDCLTKIKCPIAFTEEQRKEIKDKLKFLSESINY